MEHFFEELFAYNDHFNKKLIKLLNENSSSASEKALKLLSHVVDAHEVWNGRILRQKTLGIWELHQLKDLERMNEDNYTTSLKILRSKSLTEIIEYTNSQGKTFSNSLRDVMFHVINHSTYHRAQIATECRQYGIQPLVSDYIFYKRETE